MTMRCFFSILVLLVVGLDLTGQDMEEIREGQVSFVTSQSVYVRFRSMESISEGDTLFIKEGSSFVAALQVRNLSSISCVCKPLQEVGFRVSDPVYARVGREEVRTSAREEPAVIPVLPAEISESDTGTAGEVPVKIKQEIHGRLSVSSYSNFSGNEAARRQRMRYTFSMDANHLGNSGFSLESYISFAHSNSNREEVKANIFNGLKIYNLSVKYDFNETMYLTLGRKINPMLSSVGAIDGLQFEKRFGSLTLGAFAGSRPDYQDFGINPELLQYGAYMGHDMQGKSLSMQNSLAFVEQTNKSITDRRFIYFQHSSWILKNLNFFASAELDLYKKVMEKAENTFNLSNVYLSMRYRIIPRLSAGISYSSRKNIIYYESYKDFVERLLENEALRGWRFRINARPAKHLVLGVSAGYRYRKEDPRPSRNIYGYATYTRIPGLNASATLSYTWLEAVYLSGNIYSLGISRDIIPGKLSGGLKYRYVDYLYRKSETGQPQNVFEANLSWNIYRKLSLSAYYEGTFESRFNYNRLYVNLSQRF